MLREEETIREWGGFTYSSTAPPMFIGQFWNKPINGDSVWEEDQNVLIVMNTPGQSLNDILDYFTKLRDTVNQVYKQVGQPQKALWITAQDLSILWD